MKFYHVKNDYIKFLRAYDQKVAENKNESRPYVGVVLEDALLLIDIEKEPDAKYRRLLQNQYNAVASDFSAIEKTAVRLRSLILSDDSKLTNHDKMVKERCCDFALLESVYRLYGKSNE